MRPVLVGAVLLATLTCSDDSRKTAHKQTMTQQHSDQPVNRLAKEKSPYLLQHAHNPVDWYPWGEEAFEKARAENKPIFLSIGYSTCHWCHVMERESFESAEIAAILNRDFISVKVDREERPDVDHVYMTFVQATTGSGGWPMSVWLTPDLAPFFGGTYFPPNTAFGRPGFKEVLERIAAIWKEDPQKVLEQGRNVVRQLAAQNSAANEQGEGDRQIDATGLEGGFHYFDRSFDSVEGGFGSAPKFPRPANLFFLHRYAYWKGMDSKDGKRAADMSLHTLRKMAAGGMYDHLGGGFHRYSVDAYWHVPHYEKMLYDQGQLVVAYVEAYQITRETAFLEVARDILKYVGRDMTDEKGGFYSAEDADSYPVEGSTHKTEGAFYVWSWEEVEKLLGGDAALFCAVYGMEKAGNSPSGSDPHGELKGKNTLIRRLISEQASEKFELSKEETERRLASARERLFQERQKRPRPHLDDKIITAWNGLMISAYAKTYEVTFEKSYLECALRSARFIREGLYDEKTGKLYRSYREGRGEVEAFAADHAFLIQGLLDLYEAGGGEEWLNWAIALQARQEERFADAQGGGYFGESGEDPSILIRMKDEYDGAEPAPSSVSVLNLLRLAGVTGDSAYRSRAGEVIGSFTSPIRQMPAAVPYMLGAVEKFLHQGQQIFLSGQPDQKQSRPLLEVIHGGLLPNKTVMFLPGEKSPLNASYRDLAKDEAGVRAYVCQDFTCKLPTADPETLRETLFPSPARKQ